VRVLGGARSVPVQPGEGPADILRVAAQVARQPEQELAADMACIQLFGDEGTGYTVLEDRSGAAAMKRSRDTRDRLLIRPA